MEALPILPPTNAEGAFPGPGPDGAAGTTPEKGEMFLGILQQVMLAAAIQPAAQQLAPPPALIAPSTGKTSSQDPVVAGPLTVQRMQFGPVEPPLVMTHGFAIADLPSTERTRLQPGLSELSPPPTPLPALSREFAPAVLSPTVTSPMEDAVFPVKVPAPVRQVAPERSPITTQTPVLPERPAVPTPQVMSPPVTEVLSEEHEAIVPRPPSDPLPQEMEPPERGELASADRREATRTFRTVLMPEAPERPFMRATKAEPPAAKTEFEEQPEVEVAPAHQDRPEVVQGRTPPKEAGTTAPPAKLAEQAEAVPRPQGVRPATEDSAEEIVVENRPPTVVRQHADVRPLPIEQGVAETPGGPPQQTPFQPAPKVDAPPSRPVPPPVPLSAPVLPREIEQSVMDQVVRQVILHTNGDSSEIRVKLEPPSLGEVVVHVRMENGQMQAQIDVQQAAVKAALDAQIGQLRQSLTDRGLDVQRLDVLFGDPSTSRESSGGQDDRQQRGSSRHSSLGESPEQSQTGRMLGYNTMEIIM